MYPVAICSLRSFERVYCIDHANSEPQCPGCTQQFITNYASRLKKRAVERENKQFHIRKSIAIMEWAGRNAPESSWASLFHEPTRSSVESDSSQAPSTEAPETVVGYAGGPHLEFPYL